MKTREIDVWIHENEKIPGDNFTGAHISYSKNGEYNIKAKLLIPADPEVIEFESAVVFGTSYYEAHGERIDNHNVGIFTNTEGTFPLTGKRWKIRAEEILD